MILSRLIKGVAYDPQEGKFYKIVQIEPLLIERALSVDSEGNICYKCAFSGKIMRKKAHNLAAEMILGEPLGTKKTYFKDMNPYNLRWSNIGIIEKSEYVKMKDALKNVNGSVKFNLIRLTYTFM